MAQERGIAAIEIATDYDWTLNTGTWNAIPIGDILLDGTEIAEPEEFTTETADNLILQDGIRWNGVIRCALGAANIPAENTAFWVRVTPLVGTQKIYGSADGAKARILETGIKALSNGRAYVDVLYTFVSDTIANGIEYQA